MNEIKENINPLNNPEDHDKLVSKLKEKTREAEKLAESWENAKIKVEDRLLEIEEENKELKKKVNKFNLDSFRQRRIELNKEETKEGNEFLDMLNEKLEKKINK